MKRTSLVVRGNKIKIIYAAMLLMISFGVVTVFHYFPSQESHSMFNNRVSVSVNSTLQPVVKSEWKYVSEEDNEPDWNIPHYTPIELSTGVDPIVTLCRLDFKAYSNSPHLYPMFRDLVSRSKCTASNTKKKLLSDMLADMATNNSPQSRLVPPTGFIFHESRVGSTLVANLLATDPYSMVFSESAPPVYALRHLCNSCSRSRRVRLFRNVVTAMGCSPVHKRLFFKFQSISTTEIGIALEAFPDVPWVFLFRHPVQTMMSHLDTGWFGSFFGTPPCMRSKYMYPHEKHIRDQIEGMDVATLPQAAWCAAYLGMLCSYAIEAYMRHGLYHTGSLRGLFLDYEGLPGAVPRLILPLFGVDVSHRWLTRMKAEAFQYSKGRLGEMKSGRFTGDSYVKELRATTEINSWSDRILSGAYENMTTLSMAGVHRITKDTDNLFLIVTV